MKSAIGYCRYCGERFYIPHVNHYDNCDAYKRAYKDNFGHTLEQVHPRARRAAKPRGTSG